MQHLPPLHPKIKISAHRHGGILYNAHLDSYYKIDALTLAILLRWYLKTPDLILENLRRTTMYHAHLNDIDEVYEFLIKNQLLHTHDVTIKKNMRKLKTSFYTKCNYRAPLIRIPLFKNWAAPLPQFFSQHWFPQSLYLFLGFLFTCWYAYSSHFFSLERFLSEITLSDCVWIMLFWIGLRLFSFYVETHELIKTHVKITKVSLAWTLGLLHLDYTLASGWNHLKKPIRLRIQSTPVVLQSLLLMMGLFLWHFTSHATQHFFYLFTVVCALQLFWIECHPWRQRSLKLWIKDACETDHLYLSAKQALMHTCLKLCFNLPENFKVFDFKNLTLCAYRCWVLCFEILLLYGCLIAVAPLFNVEPPHHLLIWITAFILGIESFSILLKAEAARHVVKWNLNVVATSFFSVGLFLFLYLPHHEHIHVPALLTPTPIADIQTTYGGTLKTASLACQKEFKKDALLFELTNPELELNAKLKQIDSNYLTQRLMHEKGLAFSALPEEATLSLQKILTEQANELEKIRSLSVHATEAGMLVGCEDALSLAGNTLAPGARIGQWISPHQWEIHAILNQAQYQQLLHDGNEIFIRHHPHQKLRLVFHKIETLKPETMIPELHLKVSPEAPMYQVTFRLKDDLSMTPLLVETGEATFLKSSESYLKTWFTL